MTRVAIYRRISKDPTGEGLGVDRQRTECLQWLARHHPDWTVVELAADNDLSAYSGKPRPSYLALLGMIERREVDAVLVWHTDRLHRSPVELERYIAVCGEDPGVPTYAVTSGERDIDLTTPSGRLNARIRGSVARYESEHKSERTKSKFMQKRARREHHGGRKFGYIWESERLVPDPATAPVILADTRRVLAGLSLSALVREWTAAGWEPPHGGQEWRNASVRSVLMSPTNAGILVHHGNELGAGNWEPIVPEPEWRALVALLRDPKRRTSIGPAGRRWLGGNLFRCGVCADGTPLRSGTNTVRRDGIAVRRPAYRCTKSSHLTIMAEPVDEFVLETIAAVLHDRGAGLLVTDHAEELAKLDTDLAALRDRRKANGRLFAAGAIDEEGFVAASADLTAQIDAAQRRLVEISPDVSNPLTDLVDAPDPGAAFLALTIDRQRAVIHSVATVTIRRGVTGRAGKGKGIDYGRIVIEPR